MKTCIVWWAVLGSIAVGLLAPAAWAGGKDLPMEAKQARDVVIKFLETKNGLQTNPTIAWVKEPALKEVFPTQTFIAVQYRQYPVAFAPPEGLGSSNVFAVGKDGKLQPLTSPETLQKFVAAHFKGSMAKVTEKNADKWARAYLSLWQELVQDGFYGFEIIKVTTEKNEKLIEAKGTSMVTKGGNGQLLVTLDFGPDGVKIKPESKVIPGPRPICQATKLLDADPEIRAMAESQLLFMGAAAKPYLIEQRARTTNPHLQQAIDRVLTKIEANGW
jgi:hypothetical protein